MISVSFFHEKSITMSTNNKNLHLTNQDRTIIEKGIENGSTKAAIALTLAKTNLPSAKKSNLAEFKLTNLLIILHVQIRMNVLTITYVPVVLILNPSNAIAETNLLVPAMAVPNITIAAMTSLDILPI